MVKDYPRHPVLVKNHTKVDIEKLDKELFNNIISQNIDRKHFELKEMEEKYEFQYKGKWCDVTAICLHTMRIIINVSDKANDNKVVEKTVRFHYNLREKD